MQGHLERHTIVCTATLLHSPTRALDRTSLALTSLSGNKTPQSQYVTLRPKFISTQITKRHSFSLTSYFSSYKSQQHHNLKFLTALPERTILLFYTGTKAAEAARKRQGWSKEIGETMARKWAETP